MVGAGAAGGLEPLAQRLAGAVEADHRVVGRDARLGGEVERTDAFEIHPLQDLGVLGLERGEQGLEAAADLRRLFVRESRGADEDQGFALVGPGRRQCGVVRCSSAPRGATRGAPLAASPTRG